MRSDSIIEATGYVNTLQNEDPYNIHNNSQHNSVMASTQYNTYVKEQDMRGEASSV